MKNKFFIINSVLLVVIIALVSGFFLLPVIQGSGGTDSTETASVKPVDSSILATGTIESENEADLHFQTGGKLASLPFKEGDSVNAGDTIAQLDTYNLQQQLRLALNNQRTTQDTVNQTVENNNNGVLEGQQRVSLDTTNKSGYKNTTEVDVISSAVKRILDQSQTSLDSASINVQLANYAIQLASITAPFTGVITHEDITAPGVNVTPANVISIADPDKLVFRANVSEEDITFIEVGTAATITLNSAKNQQISGTVSKIYPQKVSLSTGESVYRVDIQADDLKNAGKLKQGGSVLMHTKFDHSVILVPAWTVLNNNSLWVMQGTTPLLKKVLVGDTVGTNVEILKGLSADDKVIVKPNNIIKKNYFLL